LKSPASTTARGGFEQLVDLGGADARVLCAGVRLEVGVDHVDADASDLEGDALPALADEEPLEWPRRQLAEGAVRPLEHPVAGLEGEPRVSLFQRGADPVLSLERGRPAGKAPVLLEGDDVERPLTRGLEPAAHARKAHPARGPGERRRQSPDVRGDEKHIRE
jgi:hypothetical protein